MSEYTNKINNVEYQGKEFRQIEGWGGRYYVSEDGDVLTTSYGRARLLGEYFALNGYRLIALAWKGHERRVAVHTVVLETFVGPRPEGMVARHLDGDQTNNSISNLTWGTASENVRDRVRHGTDPNKAKTHCVRGHPYSRENTYTNDQGWRWCRACARRSSRLQRAKRSAA